MARADDLDNPLYFVQAQYTHDSNLTRTSQAQADSYLSVTAGARARCIWAASNWPAT